MVEGTEDQIGKNNIYKGRLMAGECNPAQNLIDFPLFLNNEDFREEQSLPV